ncbi:MAG: PAS domain-containing protein [Spirulina sp.]
MSYGETDLPLTPLQYRLLEILLRWAPAILSAHAMAERGWGGLAPPRDSEIRTQIQRLRRVLCEHGAPADLVKTVPRRGYQLNPQYGEVVAAPSSGAASGRLLTVDTVPDLKSIAAHLVFFASLEDDFSRLSTAQDIMQAIGAKVGAYLATTTCLFFEIDEEHDQAMAYHAWHTADTPEVAGRYCLSDFINEDFRRAARAGDPIIINDTQSDPRVDSQRYAALKAYAYIAVPFHRQGVWKYLFVVGDSAVRRWRNDEIDLIQEVANRTFPRIERAYAEQTLQVSEARYQSLFNLMDEGFCIIELIEDEAGNPVDYRFMEVNPAFERQTGLKNVVGRLGGEITPTTNAHCLAVYEQVVRTGQPIRLENYNEHTKRWYSSYVSRIGDGRTRQAAVLFSDVTDRKVAALTLEQQIRQEYLLGDIAQEIRQSLDLSQVLCTAVNRVRDWLSCDRVVIFRFWPNWQGDVVMESVGDGWTAIQSTTIADPCFADRLIEPFRRGHVAVLDDIRQPGLEPCYVDLLQQFQVQASLAVPIFRGKILWGLLIAHQCDAPRQWQGSDIALLKRLTTQVGIAIHQSELYAQARNELAAREAMQTVLEESEARFRSLSTAAPIGICQTNADGVCLYVNPRWCELSGFSYEDCLGAGWLHSVHPDDYEALSTAWASYLEGDDLQSPPDVRLLTPTGTIRWISMGFAPIQASHQEIIGHVCTAVDITERRTTEQALRASERRLQAILDNSPAIIYLIDRQNRHLLVNQSYAQQLATTPEALIGKPIHGVWPTKTADLFAAQNHTVLDTGQRLQVEETVPLADGNHSYITVKFPLYDAEGQPYALGGISTDITERKAMEAQFYHAQWLENLGTLASGIAHDLNNVLTPILTMAQNLGQTQPGLDDKGQDQLALIERSAQRGANLVKQILAVTRAPNGDPIPVDPVALLWEEIALIQQSFPKSIRIQASLPPSDPVTAPLGRIMADPTYLHQILLNLCVNARDAMPKGGTLTLAVAQTQVDEAMASQIPEAHSGPYLVITVADTGIGITPEVQRRMFEPFFTTKAPKQGTGLGLATVRELVKDSGGFLQVWSEVGQGTRFQIYLPQVADPVPGDEEASPRPILPSPPGATVLLAEDEEILREMLRSLLESHHYHLILAEDGAAALALYQQHQDTIQLVMTDIMMPVVDGLTLIEILRAHNTEVPIVAFSGIPSHETLARALGANAFLDKPFDAETLLNQMAMALWQAQLTTPS